jgi:hypothetical protein
MNRYVSRFNYGRRKKEITWTLEKIKEGLEKFHNLYNRYPTAYDVDDFEFLPSSRQIQRRFGGLVNLRKILNLAVKNYTKGKSRSLTVTKINIRGKKYENVVFKLLLSRIGEKFIHVEKPIDYENEYNSKNRFDFYVYAKPNNFAIDVFGASSDRGLINIFNIKEKKYRKVVMENNEGLYFIYFSENNINAERIRNWINGRHNKLLPNWKIISLNEFKKELSNYTSYRAI